ncbi:MAG: putative ABC transporter ATP-binding protein, simple sugar transport system ATP-binding protein [Chloroflexi bacterium CSP1-4]|nr:MAG: putative ABC transporter ATP-binding protein, simple sugar transport system ATP-binding protein [Chloroflexi bacterium CSP1-4]
MTAGAVSGSAAPVVELRGITKRFGDLVANDRVDFDVGRGEVHALLGENGAGKTTLMRIVYGLTHPDAGQILVGGRPVAIRSPKDAIAAGIGMVTQHFSLVRPMTVAENVVLGRTGGIRLEMAAAAARVAEASERLGIRVDPGAVVAELSVGEQQRVEILKALARDCRVLILDEPTAVLVPQEVEALFATLRRLLDEGLSVVFISHKLGEVRAISDRVSVLRRGVMVGTVEGSTDERELARMMVGRPMLGIRRTERAGAGPPSTPALSVRDLGAAGVHGLPALVDLSFDVQPGEILGVAGVSGNGQTELVGVLSGMRHPSGGSIVVDGVELAGASPRRLMAAGIGRIPEDRHASLIPDLSVAYNLAIERLDDFRRGGLLDEPAIREHAEQLIARFAIRARPDDRVATLSGGNIQKVLLARVLSRDPRVLVVAQPTRGLDVGATEYVRSELLARRAAGTAVLLVSEDLDELLALADRLIVLYEGRIVGEMRAGDADPEQLGMLMAGRGRAA